MTPPKDILNDLRRAMDSATPHPNPARKAEVMAHSLEAFEAQHPATAAQKPDAAPEAATTAGAQAGTQAGTQAGAMLAQVPSPFGRLKAMLARSMTKATGTLTAATAVLAAGVLILSPQGQELLQNVPSDPAQDAIAPLSPSTADAIIEEITAVDPFIADADRPMPEPDAMADGGSAALPSVPSAQTRQILPSADRDIADGPSLHDREETGLPALPAPQAPLASGTSSQAFSDGTALSRSDPTALPALAEDAGLPFAVQGPEASFANLRSTLIQGDLPAPQDVQVAQMISAFSYTYPAPDGSAPLRPTVQVFQTPWNTQTQLVHIALQAQPPLASGRAPVNLVLLVDTSASMDDPTKLPLLVEALRQTLDHLTPDDQIAIMTYAGTSGVALPATSGGQSGTIEQALSDLEARDIPEGPSGLEEAYSLATQMTQSGEVGRVIIATDGDFDSITSGAADLTSPIDLQQDTTATLSVLHLGGGAAATEGLQGLARSGNGAVVGADTLYAAHRVLIDHINGTVEVIAEGVEMEVVFNPALVADQRQLGSGTGPAAAVLDLGRMRAGQSFTAIYEITPSGAAGSSDDASAEEAFEHTLADISLQWTDPDTLTELSSTLAVPDSPSVPSTDASFATAIAAFGQLLRGENALGNWGIADTIALARDSLGVDTLRYRAEALRLMQIAQDFMAE